MKTAQDPWIVQAMSQPPCYDHPVGEVELIETHISWIFLAGDFAYKVKKPVNFGFLNFSTLAKRHHYCHEELRLNRHFAPQLYLAVKPIGGKLDAPTLGGEPVLEYAVKMRRFPQNQQLDRMLAVNQLQPQHLTKFATQIAGQHQRAVTVDAGNSYGSPRAIIAPMLENFEHIRPLLKKPAAAGQLEKLKRWTRKVFETLKPVFRQRKADGFIRECHGDVHLANMAWVDDQPLLFDCIEFNENLRWIDVINDIAFLVMDLDDRGQSGLGWNFLNNYLQETGDYQGLTLLNFYKVYRAMVRAKVTCLRLTQGHLSATERSQTEQLFQSYLDLAEQYSLPHAAPLIITHGFSGSGKTTFATQLATDYGGIHLRSDIERKRLHGIASTVASGSSMGGGIYSAKAFAETYSRLWEISATLLRANLPVIVDATFIQEQQRELFRQLAGELKVPLIILDFPLEDKTLRQRIEQRRKRELADASEATLEVLDNQLVHHDPLTRVEEQLVVRVTPGSTTTAIAASLPK